MFSFRTFGPLRYARITLDPSTGRSRGTGFACFWNKADADKVVEQSDLLRWVARLFVYFIITIQFETLILIYYSYPRRICSLCHLFSLLTHHPLRPNASCYRDEPLTLPVLLQGTKPENLRKKVRSVEKKQTNGICICSAKEVR
jgi:RNA recognition motif-containing protein